MSEQADVSDSVLHALPSQPPSRHWLPIYTKTGLQTIGLREGWRRERGLANTRGARKRSRPTTARASAADPNPTIVWWRVRLVAQTLLTQCEASNCRRRAFTAKPPRRRTIRTPQPHGASKLSHGPVRRPTGRRGSVHDRTDLPAGCGDTHQTNHRLEFQRPARQSTPGVRPCTGADPMISDPPAKATRRRGLTQNGQANKDKMIMRMRRL